MRKILLFLCIICFSLLQMVYADDSVNSEYFAESFEAVDTGVLEAGSLLGSGEPLQVISADNVTVEDTGTYNGNVLKINSEVLLNLMDKSLVIHTLWSLIFCKQMQVIFKLFTRHFK